MRQVNSPGNDSADRIQQVPFGGTGTTKFERITDDLGLVSAASNREGETLIALDASGLVKPEYIDTREARLYSVSGDPVVPKGTTVQFVVTGPSTFTPTLQASDGGAAGSVSKTGNTISYTAPNTPKKVQLLLDGLYSWILDIRGALPVRPSIVSPVQGAVGQAATLTVTGSAYSAGSAGAFKESVWQIAENLDFTDARTIIFNAAVTGQITQLAANRNYYLRVMYKDTTGQGSDWSDVVGISTKSAFLPSTEVAMILPTAIILENAGATSFSSAQGFRINEASGGPDGRLVVTTDEADIVNAQGFHEFDRAAYVFGKGLDSAVVNTTWNPLDKGANMTLSNDDLTVVSASTGGLVRSVGSKSSGKWYWEVTKNAGVDLAVGIAKANASLANYLGGDANGYGYIAGTGQKSNNNVKSAYGAAYADGDVIGIGLDLDAGTLTFYKNGVSQGVAFSGLSGTFFAAEGTTNNGDRCTANFGANLFAYPLPNGYASNPNWVAQTKGTSSIKRFQSESANDALFAKYTALSGNGRWLSATGQKAFVGRSFYLQYLDKANLADQVLTPAKEYTDGDYFGPHVLNADGSRLIMLTGDGYKLVVWKSALGGREVAQIVQLNAGHGLGKKAVLFNGNRDLIFVISKNGIEVFKVMDGQGTYMVSAKYQAHAAVAQDVGPAAVTTNGDLVAVRLDTNLGRRVEVIEYNVATNTVTSKSIQAPNGEARYADSLAVNDDAAVLYVGSPATATGGKVYRYSGVRVGSTLTTDMTIQHTNAGANPTGLDESEFGRSMKFSRRFTELIVASMTRVHVLR